MGFITVDDASAEAHMGFSTELCQEQSGIITVNGQWMPVLKPIWASVQIDSDDARLLQQLCTIWASAQSTPIE